MSWQMESEAPREETQRRLSEKGRRDAMLQATAFEMRAEGHTREEISERTGLTHAQLIRIFRGLGRRQ